MSRPSLFNTLLPVVALGVGVLVGAYLPKGILPPLGGKAGNENAAAHAPTPKDMIKDLMEGLADFHPSGNTDEPPTAGNSGHTPAPTTEAERIRQAALPFHRTPLKLVGVANGTTIEVERATESGPVRRRVKLHAIDKDYPSIADYMRQYVGKTVVLNLSNPPQNAAGDLVGLMFIIDDTTSINAVLFRAIKQAEKEAAASAPAGSTAGQ